MNITLLQCSEMKHDEMCSEGGEEMKIDDGKRPKVQNSESDLTPILFTK